MAFESVKKIAEADFPTRWGDFRILGFEGCAGARGAKAVAGKPRRSSGPGDGRHSLRSPAGAHPLPMPHRRRFRLAALRLPLQLELALGKIAKAGAGILLYEQQEGRGIGLMAKLKAYELQDQGMDTVEANVELGFAADCRAYELPAEALKLLGVSRVRLITNNPEKVAALESAGITVVERVSAEVEPQETFERYLRTKHEKLGHIQDAIQDALITDQRPG